MFNLREYRKDTAELSDLLPWAAIVDSGIVLNKDGSLQKTISFRGSDLDSSTNEQLISTTARLNNALKRLTSGWAIFVEARRKYADHYSDENHFPDHVSWLVDAERRQVFEKGNVHFESEYFLTFQYLPPEDRASKVSSKFVTKNEDKKSNNLVNQTLDYFKTTVNRLFDIFKDFMFELEHLDDTKTLSYLHDCISTKRHKVHMPDIPMYIDSIIPDEPLSGGLDPQLGDAHLKVISIKGFPSSTTPGVLDQLNHLAMEYRWSTRFIPLDKLEAEKTLKAYRRQWFTKRKGIMSMMTEVFSKQETAMVDNAALRKSQDVDTAMQGLADDHVSFGYYTSTITVWDKDERIAYEKQREVERIINGLGFVTVAESFNAVEAWLSSLPGHIYANVRMTLLHTLNLSHMIPFSAVWAGIHWNKHLNAPPLLYAQTAGNTPFRLSNHIGDVGHQMILGPTGAGKSVLLNMISLQFLRYKDAQVYIFDKGGSFLASTYGVNGRFYNVGDPQELSFQPLAEIDNEVERTWASEWVLGIFENEGVNIDPDVKDQVWKALTNLSNTPVEQRTMTGLQAFLQDQKLRVVLQPYVLGGPYGAILDADEQYFSTKRWQCFEMEDIMQMPNAVGPVLSYLFHALEKNFDGSPTLMILDEAWLFMDHPIFSGKIREWLKTLRKLNVSVIFATQSVSDALESGITSALNESCPSRIFLPNDRANEENVKASYRQFGLNDRQISIIANATPKKQYYFESSKGNSLFDLGLSELAISLCGVSSPQSKGLIKEFVKKHEYPMSIISYMKQVGLEWAAEVLQEEIEEGK